MFDTPLMKRIGVTPAKLVLVGVLGVVFVIVIVIQWPASSPTLPSTNVNEVKASEDEVVEVEASGRSTTPPDVKPPTETDWPALSMGEIVQHDPFLLPIHLRPVRREVDKPTNPQDPHILQTLSQAEGGMLLLVGKEHVARVGAVTLRPGDKIGSYRVSKIDATGIWLVDEDEVPK